jgi:hypothetical protein
MRLAIALFAATLYAQPPQLHITAELLSTADTHAMFGPLAKQYTAAKVLVCSNSTANLSVPQGIVAQSVKTRNNITILPNVVAMQVIALAQGATVKSRSFRYGLAAIQLAAIASTWAGLSATVKNTLTSTSLAGSSALPIILNATTAQSLISYSTAALPDPLQFAGVSCASGIALTEAGAAGGIDVTIAAPVTK